jgi:hypothetical protein
MSKSNVFGLGEPDYMRIGFTDAEMRLVSQELRSQRDEATREAAGVLSDLGADGRDTDRAHDRLREIESVMREIEDRAMPDAAGETWLTGASRVFEQTVVGVAERALAALVTEHERVVAAGPCDGAGLLVAAETVRAAMSTLVAAREVEHGPVDEPYRGPR